MIIKAFIEANIQTTLQTLAASLPTGTRLDPIGAFSNLSIDHNFENKCVVCKDVCAGFSVRQWSVLTWKGERLYCRSIKHPCLGQLGCQFGFVFLSRDVCDCCRSVLGSWPERLPITIFQNVRARLPTSASLLHSLLSDGGLPQMTNDTRFK